MDHRDTILELSNTLTLTDPRLKLVSEAAQHTQPEETLYIVVPSTAFSPSPSAAGATIHASQTFDELSQLLSGLYNAASVVFYGRNTRLTSVQVLVEPLSAHRVEELRARSERFRRVFREEIRGNSNSLNQKSEPVRLPEGLWSTVVLGGTFDHLHAGHKVLLTMAAWLAKDRLVVGITDKNLLQRKKYPEYLETPEQRLTSVRQFLTEICPSSIKLDIVPIQDVYGPTATDPACDAIVCSIETIKGAESVNQKRAENHFNQLETFVVDVVAPEAVSNAIKDANVDKRVEQKMGSTSIREWLAHRQQPQQ